MNKQDLIDFYKNKQGWLPDDIQKGKEHFNVFRLDSYVGEYAEPVPYTRRDFYKITFLGGTPRYTTRIDLLRLRNRLWFFLIHKFHINGKGWKE